MCSPNQQKEEEYVDYSCSTAVERLTRDVESLLRSWHVHDGCDRHFAASTDPNGLTLLRAERLTWIAALPQRRTIRIELELALWDGPASKAPPKRRPRRSNNGGNDNIQRQGSSNSMGILLEPEKDEKVYNRRSSISNDECVTNTKDSLVLKVCKEDGLDDSTHSVLSRSLDYQDSDDEAEEKELHKHLPKSLQRPQHPADITDMPDSLFDNFSTMFGIGQHITLAPTNPAIDLGIGPINKNISEEDDNNEIGSVDSDWSNLNTTVANFCSTLLGRHKPTQARWVFTQLLASWMQTALNCAAINCQSCLPVFGVWGHYPSPSLPSSEEPTIASSYWNKNDARRKASIPVFPSWMDAAQALRAPIDSTVAAIEAQDESRAPLARSPSQLAFRRRRKQVKRTPSLPSLDVLVRANKQGQHLNSNHAPPIVTGSVVPTADTHASFTCTVLPHTLLEGPVDRLSTWGNLFLRHCSSSSLGQEDDLSVVLSGAQHVYSWSKTKIPASESEAWRGIDPKEYWKRLQSKERDEISESEAWRGAEQNWKQLQSAEATEMFEWDAGSRPPAPETVEVEDYRCACRAHALHLLEKAIGEKCWGPRQDPIYALHASVGWKSRMVFSDADDEDEEEERVEPLGSFPSPTQCAAYCTSSSLLDPRNASFFKVQTFLDHQALEPTLATAQRCTLACLIRASTLSPLTLLRHLLWEEDIIEDWDHKAGNRAALRIARKAEVGEATNTLVDVMDWASCAEDMISEKGAKDIVKEVLDGTTCFGFPSPPEDMFSFSQQQKGPINNNHPLLEPLFQSAPVGRLVSDLCTRMAQLRTPCSMALVWSTFCNELRDRWDAREPLLRMNYVAGLDPTPAVLAERRKVSTIGVKADLSAFLNCSEPDPDDQHCLIGQKLQVFNIGIEAISVMDESRDQRNASFEEETEGSRWKVGFETDPPDGTSSPTPNRANSSVSLASDGHPSPQELEPPSDGKVVNLNSFGRLQIPPDLFKGKVRKDAIIDDLLPSQNALRAEEMSILTGAESLSEFFDAEECGMSIFTSRSVFSRNLAAATAVHRIDRKGARCPLHGRSLVASGDQVYAPYLRRPEPLTDDIILERRMMLSEESYSSEETADDGRTPIQRRLDIAYRLQKPKLLSDMNAFKAANPGAVFQDFVSWYGNPGNPLDDYSVYSGAQKSKISSHNGLASAETVAARLDKATEAIHILNETRNFWSSTWDEATPTPASEQKPLYEVLSTVEMTLDYLENMHPAILLNQVMAVTLANSYFILVASAKDAVKVPIIEAALRGLRLKIEKVLDKLAEEASNATRAFYNMQADDAASKNKSFVSVGVINGCEQVCSSFGEAEVMVALATSVLQKFPEQYETVQCILKHADGDKVELQDPIGQSRILDAIAIQQARAGEATNKTPKPLLREYLLRNVDDSNPCQLSVRYGNTSANHHHGKESIGDVGLLVALTKSSSD